MIRKLGIAVCTLVLATSLGAAAQTPPPDPVRDALIPPDVVMSHQQELGLSDAQRVEIQSDVLAAQAQFMRWQLRLKNATAKLVDILHRTRVDQAQALAQMDAVLSIEREVKHAQLTLMIQIKNELSPQQQAAAHGLAAGGNP
jgi:Spy/CpxP family protein refolding chaperone